MEHDYKPKKTDRLISREEDENLLIFDPDTGSIKVLNETAALIWNSIDEKNSVKDIVDIICRENPDEDRKTIEEDVLRFLRDLQEHSYIEE
ncbi:MAG: PqqD family protein [Theionarchaea archaeon]|nr:MAG: hypothetical protein AYK19_11100 [Theionarchaea archaeon DG-70-1]MBU7028347.1 PqqD family protein [Theionarchaea archaeon]